MPSQITVTATIQDPSGTALQGNAFVRFKLRNFQGFVPVVSGTAIICETQIDSLPGAGGAISQLLWGNNNITPSSTFYTVEFWNQGRITSSGNYIFNANTSLNTAAQINTPPVPPGFSLVLENNGTLNSSQSTLNLESTDSSVTITDEGGGTLNLVVPPPNVVTPNRWRGWIFDGSPAQAIHGPYGCQPNYSSNSTATINGTTTEPPYLSLGTITGGQSSFSLMGTTSIGARQISVGRTQLVTARLLAVSTVTFRAWWALADTTVNVPGGLNTDAPNQNVIGFRFSTAAGDTTWKAYCSTSSTNFTLVDTGKALDTLAGHVFSFSVSPSAVVFSIDGSTVATITTNIPATSVLMQDWLTVVDLSGSAVKQIAIAESYWQTST